MDKYIQKAMSAAKAKNFDALERIITCNEVAHTTTRIELKYKIEELNRKIEQLTTIINLLK